ncbi:hypothetical protein RUND412_010699 [Rhizina undulata]
MPTIEVLPSTSLTSGANWTYTSRPPPLAHTNALPTSTSAPRGARTRGGAGAHSHETSAARQRQINSRILELERDNYRDVVIPIPVKKGKDSAGGNRSSRTKATSTQSVRRILASQKTFLNHLADSAALNPVQSHIPAQSHRRCASSVSSIGSAQEPGNSDRDNEAGGILQEAETGDGGPPLGYGAATASPSIKPKRLFCEICGYWGRYRCGKCAARYCGLECLGVHSETRCNKFYA